MVRTDPAPAAPAPTRAELAPAQQAAFDGVQFMLPAATGFAVWGAQGSGVSTVLLTLRAESGGALVGPREIMAARRAGSSTTPIEELLYTCVREALVESDIVYVDGLRLLQLPMGAGANPKRGLFSVVLAALIEEAAETGKKLIFGGALPCEVEGAFSWGIHPFQEADYAHLLRAFLGEQAVAGLDVSRVYRVAPKLSAHELQSMCLWLRRARRVSTQHMLDYIASRFSRSNVDLEEVQPVEFHDLKGLDELLDALETHVILPLERDALATRLQLRPKRGVLLAGPPGTGKTTVGRVLARRLGSRFFLIDGTLIAGTHDFYERVQRVFNAAKESGDCIIFIDDTDVIFEDNAETGLYRYLLTMLDGLESKSAGRICVMMTAMNLGALPPALVRSGRIELWLETRLPDAEARRAILEQCLAPVAADMGAVDAERVAVETDGLTGADLKRLVEDGKLLLARDLADGRPLAPPTAYLLTALTSLRAHRQRYAADRAAAPS